MMCVLFNLLLLLCFVYLKCYFVPFIILLSCSIYLVPVPVHIFYCFIPFIIC